MRRREITFPDGRFDELVVPSASVHFEMLDDDVLWFGIEEPGKSRIAGTIYVREKRLRLNLVEWPHDMPIEGDPEGDR